MPERNGRRRINGRVLPDSGRPGMPATSVSADRWSLDIARDGGSVLPLMNHSNTHLRLRPAFAERVCSGDGRSASGCAGARPVGRGSS